jgi:hypothetical protein
MAKTNKLAALQTALNRGSGKADQRTEAPAPGRRRAAASAGEYKTPPSREGKTPVTAFLSPEYKRSLRLIQAKHDGKTVQGLMAEALNMLFEHYGVPTVSDK